MGKESITSKLGETMTEEQEKLVIDNMSLIKLMIKELHCQWKTEDEWQEYYDYGLEGLIRGAKNYDESKGKPSTFLCKCIANMIQRAFYLKTMPKRLNPAGSDLSLNKMVNDEEESEFGEFIPDPNVNVEYEVEKKIEYEKLLVAVDSLKNVKDRVIVKKYYGLDGYKEVNSCEQIAKEFGVSKNMINTRLHRAINKLKIYYMTHDKDISIKKRNEIEVFKLEEKQEARNDLLSLNDSLFAELSRLSDDNIMKSEDSFKKEMERSKAITGVAQSIINNANLILNGAKFKVQNGEKVDTPKLLSSSDK